MGKMKRRLKNKYLFIVLFAIVLFLTGCGNSYTSGDPVEPIVPGVGDIRAPYLTGRSSLLSSQVTINDLKTSFSGNHALVASRGTKVQMLNKEGRLAQEVNVVGEPVVTSIDQNGRYWATGTREGNIYFIDKENDVVFSEKLSGSINQLALSPDGKNLAVLARQTPGSSQLYLFNDRGRLIWQKSLPNPADTSQGLVISSGNGVGVVLDGDYGNILRWYNWSGDFGWQRRGVNAAHLSSNGSTMIVAQDKQAVLLNTKGETLWQYDTGITLTGVQASPSGKNFIAYSGYSIGRDKAFYYSKEGNLLWEKNIPSSSEVAMARSGDYVVVTSWRHHREDHTQIKVYDKRGNEYNSLEVGSRAQQASMSVAGNILALGGEDGNIYFIDVSSDGERYSSNEPMVSYKSALAKGPQNNMITLFFYNNDVSALVPVNRQVNTDVSIRTAVNELIRGPRRNSYLVRTLPGDVHIGVELNRGILNLNLPGRLADAGSPAEMRGLIDSLLYTVSQFPEVKQVQFLVDGQKVSTLGGSVNISRLFPAISHGSSPNRHVLYEPSISGRRYYLGTREVTIVARSQEELGKTLVQRLIDSNEAFFPKDTKVLDVKINRDLITVNINADFRELVSAASTPEMISWSQMLQDAITLTLTENLSPQEVQILINGSSYKFAPGFPDLRMKIDRPIYLNPEI